MNIEKLKLSQYNDTILIQEYILAIVIILQRCSHMIYMRYKNKDLSQVEYVYKSLKVIAESW